MHKCKCKIFTFIILYLILTVSFAHNTFCVLVSLCFIYFFGIAATCQPCTTCLHIPLLYIPAYLNIQVYSILSCTFFYILFFISYFLLISFYVYFLCVVFYNICTVHGADLTHISLLVIYSLYNSIQFNSSLFV